MEAQLCYENLKGTCSTGQSCVKVHHHKPYLWQIKMDPTSDWRNLQNEGDNLEQSYSDPSCLNTTLMASATGGNGEVFSVNMHVDLTQMLAKVFTPSEGPYPDEVTVAVRRLSTPSYVNRASEELCKYYTQWRWYWLSYGNWIPFKDDTQAVLEKKYLFGQEVFRFEKDMPVAGAASSASHTFLLNFNQGTMTCITDSVNSKTFVCRRPLLFSGQSPVPWVPITSHPFISDAPENWMPMDDKMDYELVPLNPDSVEYHLVASEFHASVPKGRKVCDVFRVQNPFLWHKFSNKNRQMRMKGKSSNEKQLFHGTSTETAVQSICRQNFDWRLCGKNNIKFGRGSYFARDASFSDHYSHAGLKSDSLHWMFLARVLVGRFVGGNSSMLRPPPIDPSKPHGDLYDSCVECIHNPKIFVIFDSDQCYPEYLFSYNITK